MKYVLYVKDKGDWLFWQNDFGWGHIGSATLFERTTPKILPGKNVYDPFVDLAIEGSWLPVGASGELAPLAPAMLDMMEVLAEHGVESHIPESYIPQHALAGKLASSLRQADPLALDSEAIYENGYCFRVTNEIEVNK